MRQNTSFSHKNWENLWLPDLSSGGGHPRHTHPLSAPLHPDPGYATVPTLPPRWGRRLACVTFFVPRYLKFNDDLCTLPGKIL